MTKYRGVALGIEKGKVHFWPSNSCPSLILAIQLQNRVALTIQLSKPVTFGHPGGFECGFADVDATWLWGPPVSPPLPLLSFFSPLPHPSLFCAAAEAAGTGGRRCLTARPRQGRRPDQPAPATAPSHRLGHVSAMREPSRRAARGLAGHHDERCALHPAPSPTQLSPPSLASRRRLPLPSSLPEPSRAPLGAQNGAAAR